MPAATAITIAAQQALAGRSRRLAALAPLARGAPPAWIAGAVCGAAYVVAELPNSFLKRRLGIAPGASGSRSEEHTSELQSQFHLVCRLLLEKKKIKYKS